MNYFKNAINRVKNRLTMLQHYILPVTGFMLIGIIWYSIFKISFFLQKLIIPDNVLFYTPSVASYMLIGLPSFFLSLGLGFFSAGYIINLIKAKRDRFNKVYKSKAYKSNQRSMMIFIKYTSLVTVPLIILGIFSYIYMTPKGIYCKNVFSTKEKYYKWSDIKGVYGWIYISHGRGSTMEASYKIEMNDNSKYELSLNDLNYFLNNYSKIAPYLKSNKSIVKRHKIAKSIIKSYCYNTPIVQEFIKIIKE